MQPLRDSSGTPYTSPANKPAASGTQVIAHTSKGNEPATMVGGHLVINKKT